MPTRSIANQNGDLGIDPVDPGSILTGSVTNQADASLARSIETKRRARGETSTQMRQWAAASAEMVAQFGAPGADYDPF